MITTYIFKYFYAHPYTLHPCTSLIKPLQPQTYLFQLHYKGDIAAQGGCELVVAGCQVQALWGTVGTLLFSGCVHLLHTFGAVICCHFTVAEEHNNREMS